jgi:hypothetical protein
MQQGAPPPEHDASSVGPAIAVQLNAARRAVSRCLDSPLRLLALGLGVSLMAAYSVESGIPWPQPADIGSPAWWIRLIPALSVILPAAFFAAVVGVVKPLARIVIVVARSLDPRRRTASVCVGFLTVFALFDAGVLAAAGTGIEATDGPVRHRVIAALWLMAGVMVAGFGWRVRMRRSSRPRRSPRPRPRVAH